jgi:hypothetical protein
MYKGAYARPCGRLKKEHRMMPLSPSEAPLRLNDIKAKIADLPMNLAISAIDDWQEWANTLARDLGGLKRDLLKVMPSKTTENHELDYEIPLEERIVKTLRDNPLTYRELYAVFPRVPHLTIYRLIKDELLPQGRLIYTKAKGQQAGTLVTNPDWEGNIYLDKLLVADPSLANHETEFQTDNAAAVDYYERVILRKRNEGQLRKANRLWQAIRNRTVIGAWEHIVRNPHEDDGFERMRDTRPDLTIEAIIDRWPEKFDPEVVAAARRRLGTHRAP